MTWKIHAWLNDGRPQLEIIDPDSGNVHLRWGSENDDEVPASRDVHRLFRELLLLSCKQDLHGEIPGQQ